MGRADLDRVIRRDGTNRPSPHFPPKQHEDITMLDWILILLVVAAVAALLGFNSISGAALTGAKLLIGIVLVLFLLVLFGLIALA
jgi:uncharacterized membrane protein YtjA (UPF0391 family)